MQTPTQDTIAAVGIDNIALRVEAGATQAELAQEMGVGVARLNAWIHGSPERSARVRAAMAASAEALADRGHQELTAAGSSMPEITRARALEQHWRWRAAIRNPAYRERTDSTLQVSVSTQQLTRAQLEAIAAQGLPMVERIEEK